MREIKSALRVGFVPLTDCAPLVMARNSACFQKYGVRVELSRELGWATIRDKVIHGELAAAHALAAMPMAATLGLGSIPCDCLTALVLNLNGNAITLSNELWRRGIRDGETGCARRSAASRREKIYTFGAVSPFSSHRHLLRQWGCRRRVDSGARLADRDRAAAANGGEFEGGWKPGRLLRRAETVKIRWRYRRGRDGLRGQARNWMAIIRKRC